MIVLDGATGTELGRRGVDTRGPLFSAQALLSEEGIAAVRAVHAAYVRAGAQVITANTFRTNPRKAGARWEALTALAVGLARESGAVVAGSIAPAADCYRPELRPEPPVARREHGVFARALADAGCDLLLVETVATADEGLAAVEAAASTGLPVWVAAMAMADGRMRGGDDLGAFFRDARAAGARAALINCVPVAGVEAGLKAAADCGLPFGAYAHMGEVDEQAGWPPTPVLSPGEYAARAASWLERGATIVGGCCGTTPAHIEALARLSPLRDDPLRPPRGAAP
ncbi:MAG: homocysteine S-methyltransferase family protein [Myxococcales bacterium]